MPSWSLSTAATFSPSTGPSSAGVTSLPVASGRFASSGVCRSTCNDIGAPVASVSDTSRQSSCDTLLTIAHAWSSDLSSSTTRYAAFHVGGGTAYDTRRSWTRPAAIRTPSVTLSVYDCGTSTVATLDPSRSITVSVLSTSSS